MTHSDLHLCLARALSLSFYLSPAIAIIFYVRKSLKPYETEMKHLIDY